MPPIVKVVLGLGSAAAAVAALASPSGAASAAGRVWPPFVLVAGLLAVGVVAHQDGLFEAAAARLARLPGGPAALLVFLLLLVAAVTAVLNLDTAVAFLTPILVLSARRRNVSEIPFLYGAVFMSNSASLLLPGSNLTNLLVLADNPVPGTTFAARMLPAWVAAVAVTIAVLAARHRRALRPAAAERVIDPPPVRLRGGLGLAATAAVAVLVVAVSEPALPVFAVGAAAVALRFRHRRLRPGDVVEAVSPGALLGLFGVATALSALAAAWTGPAALLEDAGPVRATVSGAVGAVTLNNLPAAALLAPNAGRHPEALLLGLNLGPNLAVTGSLSALLWFQAARRVGARPSPRTFSRIGVVLAPLTMIAALAAFAAAPGFP